MTPASTACSFLTLLREDGLRTASKTALEHLRWRSKASLLNVTVRDAFLDDRFEQIPVEAESEEVVTYTGTHKTVPKVFSNQLGRTTTAPKHCWRLQDARIMGRYGIVVHDGRRILPSTLGWQQKNTPYKRKFAETYRLWDLLAERVTPRTRMQSCFLLSATRRGINNFGLWLYETLPKMYWYRRYTQRTGQTPTIVTPKLQRYQRRTLEHVGCAPDAYYEFSEGVLSPSQLVIPPQPGHSRWAPWHMSTRSLNWTRTQLTQGIDAEGAPDRVYLSREDADWRTVSNEHAVVALLNDYGFEKVVPSTLDVFDQMQVFAGADIVVGPHGAGNAHMLHSNSCTWLELFPGCDAAKPFYFVLATRLGHEYEYLIAEPDGFQHQSKRDPRHRDMRVDLDELDRVVDTLLRRRSPANNCS